MPATKRSPDQPLTIDQWFAQQDRDIDEAFKVLKRNKRRRKVDLDELHRRSILRLAAEQEGLLVQAQRIKSRRARFSAGEASLMELARLLVELGLEIARDEMLAAAAMDRYKYARREDGSAGSRHYWAVRRAVYTEMRAET
jgi:hypothetical protein